MNPQRWNRYAYALANPGRYVDPDGRIVKLLIVAAKAVYKGYDAVDSLKGAAEATSTILSQDARVGEGERLKATGTLLLELSGASDVIGGARRGAKILGIFDGSADGVRSASKLTRVHADSSLSSASLDFWRKKSTEEIVDSLKDGSAKLKIRPDGLV